MRKASIWLRAGSPVVAVLLACQAAQDGDRATEPAVSYELVEDWAGTPGIEQL